jgi:hypothetical protein
MKTFLYYRPLSQSEYSVLQGIEPCTDWIEAARILHRREEQSELEQVLTDLLGIFGFVQKLSRLK